jgi:hypothetical protein
MTTCGTVPAQLRIDLCIRQASSARIPLDLPEDQSQRMVVADHPADAPASPLIR